MPLPHPRLLLPVVALAAVVALPAEASARHCPKLPATVAPTTSDAVILEDSGDLVVRERARGSLRDVRVYLKRAARVYASARIERLSGVQRVRPTMWRNLGRGTYRLVVSGRQAGCPGRGTAQRRVRLRDGSLPVRAASTSAYVEDYAGGMPVLVRSVGRRRILSVQVALLDARGTVISSARSTGAFRDATLVTLPLDRPLAPGRYALRLSGRAGGASGPLRRVERLALRSAGDAAAAPSPGAPPAPAAGQPSSGVQHQHVRIDWRDGAWSGRDRVGFVLPGIGSGEVVCRPDATALRVIPSEPSRETAMVSWTVKDWVDWREQAVREAVRDTHTAAEFNEGFNKFGPPEKRSTGSFESIVSDRGPLGGPGAVGAPATLVWVSWTWDFSEAGRERCAVSATLVTDGPAESRPVSRSAGISWRGSDNAAGRDSAAVDVPGVGRLTLTCPAAGDGDRRVRLDGVSGGQVTVREGSEEHGYPQDGPLTAALPTNGMVKLNLPDGTTAVVASRFKVNDPEPAGNHCHVAAQVHAP